jgi:hypothetical protein
MLATNLLVLAATIGCGRIGYDNGSGDEGPGGTDGGTVPTSCEFPAPLPLANCPTEIHLLQPGSGGNGVEPCPAIERFQVSADANLVIDNIAVRAFLLRTCNGPVFACFTGRLEALVRTNEAFTLYVDGFAQCPYAWTASPPG